MGEIDFARHVKECSLFMMVLSYGMARDKIEDYLATNIPDSEAFWREPIRVMAMGGYYCGADEWMKDHTEEGRT